MAGAVFGDVELSLFVAGAVFGEIWNDSPSAKCSPNSVFNTWVLTVSEKAGWLDRGGGQNSSLFSCFRACMCIFVAIYVLFGWRMGAWTGFVCKFS